MGEETSSLGLQQPVQGRLRHSQVWPLEHAGQNTAPTPKQLVAGRRLPDQHNVDRIPAIISTAQPHPPAFGGFSLMPSRSKLYAANKILVLTSCKPRRFLTPARPMRHA